MFIFLSHYIADICSTPNLYDDDDDDDDDDGDDI